ncbi:MAG: right-handed parallel beta-helix repeat-containing protein [Ruminococcus sp.]|nr:right-handed parallel beta-helix repeat-containing protein [Ruminococcus sp.]
MKKIIIKAIPALLIILTLATLGLVSVSAASSYTNSKGTVKVVCGSYKKIFNAKKYNKNFSRALNAALETARKKATNSKIARVTVSKGHYKLDRTIIVYSNTTLVAAGSYFRYYGNLLRNGFDKRKSSGRGYTSSRNITIKGGEWEQLIDFKYAASEDSTKWHSTFRFAHCYNIKVKDAKFKNNYNCHDIEIAGVKNSEFYNNCFYNTKSVNGIANSGGRESFQIDVNTSSAMPYFPEYDKTPCKNINIHNNTFKNKFRAVGSHHAVVGKTYSNITVHHNKMVNIAGVSVYAVYWTNSKIYSNTMTDVGFGVDMRSMINSTSTNFHNLDKLSYQQSENAIVSSKTYIYGNKINVRTADNIMSRPCGIRALGDYFASDDKATGVKAGVYKIYNVNVGVDPAGAAMPNTITGNLSVGIQLNYGINSVVKNNNIDLQNSAMNISNGIELRGCDKASVASNTIKNGSKGEAKGIYIYESDAKTFNSLLNISDNKISGFTHSGIFVKRASAVTVAGNSVSDCINSALMLKTATETSIARNSFTDCSYGANVTDGSEGVELSANTISAFKSGLYIVNASEISAINNNITSNSNAVYLKKTGNIRLVDNVMNSFIYGICLSGDCIGTEIVRNAIYSDDECVYFNGDTSADKAVIKTLTVTDNTLDCPAEKAAVRVVYDNVGASIHSNNRTDGSAPYYRFKGDNETKYRRQAGDITLDNLTLDTAEGVNKLSWSSDSAPDGYFICLDGLLVGDVKDAEYVLDSYAGEEVVVTPYKLYGNITHMGVPMSVSA